MRLDENDTLGKYLKPVVWEDSFLSHPEFSKHFVLIDAQDFAAYTTQTGEEIKIKARKVPKFVAGKALKDAVK